MRRMENPLEVLNVADLLPERKEEVARILHTQGHEALYRSGTESLPGLSEKMKSSPILVE
jgi:hypothetical protein